ncbi:MAG TPA: PAS domain S-box protein [Spirochaetota bacterium]|nr:PAS domain S-box protein [Spirochaetota bacterium]HNT11069.1 PAS domain S-box protein [Spirochaetota bacterium]
MAHVLSLISFTSFLTLLYFSVSVLRTNPHAYINRGFFAMTMSWVVIAFSYSFLYNPISMAHVPVWVRIASIGWFLVPGTTLHATFFLIKRDQIGLHWWIYPLMYLPACVYLIADAASDTIVLGHIVFAFGGPDAAGVPSPWFAAFVATSFVYFSASLGMIFYWFLRSLPGEEKRVAGSFLAVGLPVLAVGTVTDGLLPLMKLIIVPPLAPVLISVWIAWIWLAISRHQVLDITPAVVNRQFLASIDRHQMLMENFMDIVWTMNLDLRITFTSSSCLHLLGYTPEEMRGLLLNAYITPESFAKCASLLASELTNDSRSGSDPTRSIRMDVEYIRKDGTTFWAEVHAKFIRRGGAPVGLIGISRDISSRRLAEERLRHSEEKYRDLVEHANDIIYHCDINGITTYVNPTTERILGYANADMIGRHFLDVIPAEHRSAVAEHYRAQFLSRTTTTYHEVPVVSRDGSIVWFGQNVQLVADGNNRVQGFQGIARDITERKRIEDQLRKRTEIIERDLSNAQIIQRAMLPESAPAWDRLAIAYRYRPLDKIGGDFFSFTHLQEGGMGVFIGDVSGHGVSAALFLSLLKAETDHVCRAHGLKPHDFIERLNANLIPSMPHHFVTAIYGRFYVNPDTGRIELSFANGGHPNPIIHHRDSGIIETLDSHGPVIGKFPNAVFQNMKIDLRPGDRVFFYTDGIPESRNARNEYLGFDRLPSIIEYTANANLDDSLEAIIQTVGRFRGGLAQEDDMVLIGCEVRSGGADQ